MRDDDLLLTVPQLSFGSGVVGVCDVCGKRQAVIILNKERYKLCVIDFLNKTWSQPGKKPGAPLPAYRSDRVWFETKSTKSGKSPAIVLSPTKVFRHPVVLITPDIYGLTTSVLDAAIRFAREGFEVLLPDVSKTESVGPSDHLALRLGVRTQGGVPMESSRVVRFLQLYADAMEYLRGREMVDSAKSAVFGLSYGGSLALGVAARDQRLSAVALAYPMPIRPPEFARLISAPVLVVGGSNDRWANRAKNQLVSALPGTVETEEVTAAKHNFLARDLSSYDLVSAEKSWKRIVEFLRSRLLPPPPKSPIPPRPVAAVPPPSPPIPASKPATPPAASTTVPTTPAPSGASS